MSKTFFDHFNQVIKTKSSNYWKSLSEEDKKAWNTYMINRYLSMNPDWIVIVDIFQKYNHSLDNEMCYILLTNYISKTNKFIRYIKKDKGSINKDLIKYLSEYFECSLGEAEDYIKLLSKEDIQTILEDFGLEKKIITKLLKEN